MKRRTLSLKKELKPSIVDTGFVQEKVWARYVSTKLKQKKMLRLVINLDRSKDRWKLFKGHTEKLGIPFQRVPAVDGRQLSEEALKKYILPSSDNGRFLHPCSPTKNEVAAFLSHRKCWKILVESTETWALIAEDDAEFSSRAKFFCSTPNWIPQGVHVAFVSTYDTYHVLVGEKLSITETQTSLLHVLDPDLVGTQAYFISKTAAKKALELSKQICSPADIFLLKKLSPMRQAFIPWMLSPACAKERCCASVIDSAKEKRRDIAAPWRIKYHPVRLWIKAFDVFKAYIKGHREIIIFK